MGKLSSGNVEEDEMESIVDAPCEDVDIDDYAPETPLPSGEQFFLDGNFLPISFRQESFVLCRDVIEYVCRHDGARPPPNKTTTIMRSLVDDMLRSRLETMHDLVLRFDVHERDQLEMLNSLATMMFDDQVVTWGRIVTLCAFCGYLARYCREQCLPPDYGDVIADVLNCIIVNRLGLWIVANGGWVSLVCNRLNLPRIYSF